VPDLGGQLCDVGSGAGFPGLALKIWRPEIELTLIESNGKKCAFLAEAIRELRISDTEVFRGRYADFPLRRRAFQTITSRGVGKFSAFLVWAARHIDPSGRVMIWTGNEGIRELQAVRGWRWRDPELIPKTERRFIVVGMSAGDAVGTMDSKN